MLKKPPVRIIFILFAVYKPLFLRCNMSIYFRIFCLIFLSTVNVWAGSDGLTFGPRALSLGQSGIMQTDYWASFHNPGALGWIRQSGASTAFDSRYQMSALNTMAFAGAYRSDKAGTFGLGASRFGSEVFFQNRLGLSWAKAFGIASIGIEGQVLQIGASEFPTRSFGIINLGGLAQLTPKVHFGATVSNVLQAKASTFQEERLPTIARAGIAWIPNKNVRLLSEVQKDLDLDAQIKLGLEYQVIENLWARTGFTTLTNLATGGLGFKWRNLYLDYGISHHPDLGFSQSFGLSMAFGAEKSSQKEEK